MQTSRLLGLLEKYLGFGYLPPLMLWGPPGTGKSAVVREAARDLGLPFVDLRLSQMSPVDLRGVPVPDPGSRRTGWYPPEELPDEERDGPEGILCQQRI